MSRNHRGKHSEKYKRRNNQRREAISYIFGCSFRDLLIKETVSTATESEVNNHTYIMFGDPTDFFIEPFIDGVVLLSPVEVSYWENNLPPVPDLKVPGALKR